MTAASHVRTILGLLVAATALTPPAEALLTFGNGTNTVTVTADYGLNYDSNLFVHAGGGGDTYQTFSVGTEYARRAGLIKVDASLAAEIGRFEKFSAEDFANPRMSLRFTKDQGRLTGNVRFSAARESTSDSAANIRANSWDYAAGLNLRYPLNDRYYFTSVSDFSFANYLGNVPLFNLASFAEALDMYYRYNSKLDLLSGYRVRWGDAQGAGRTQDNDLHLGATGRILPKLSGTISLGYQWRQASGGDAGRYGALSSSVSLGWPMTKQVQFSSVLSRDFMTTATDVSVEATSVGINAVLKPAGPFNVTLGTSYAVNRYLGALGGGREDHAPSASIAISATLRSHLSASLSYAYTDNRSNVAYSQFSRNTASLSLSARF